jgi:hypothetical protein
MGMFDSFLVDIDAHAVEVQTKRFDQVLARYRVGDVVSGAAPGVQVLTDQLALDAAGQQVYGEREGASWWTIFIVLGHGLFACYEVQAGRLSVAARLARIRALAAAWEDSARLLGRMAQSVGEKQAQIERLGAWLGYVRATVADARRLRAGEQLQAPFGLERDATVRLKSGEDPLAVLEDLLLAEPADAMGLGFAGPFRLAERDPLAPYRL